MTSAKRAVGAARGRGRQGAGRKAIVAAEKSVIRAAMGIVNYNGWAFDENPRGDGLNIVLFPGSVRRLECAIARLKLARKEAAMLRRKYT